MWAMVGGWVRTLIVIVLIGNLVDIVLPKGDLRRYAGLIVGLILLAVMIRPLVGIVGWMNQSGRSQAFNWVADGPSLNGAIADEERHQTEAMVETITGVVDCQVQVLSSTDVGMVVRIKGKVSRPVVKAMATQAVSVIMGDNIHLQRLQIVSQA